MPSSTESICGCGSGVERARSPPEGKVGGCGPCRSTHDMARAANAAAVRVRLEFIAAQQPQVEKLGGAVVDVEPDREVLGRIVDGEAIVDGPLAHRVLNHEGGSTAGVKGSSRRNHEASELLRLIWLQVQLGDERDPAVVGELQSRHRSGLGENPPTRRVKAGGLGIDEGFAEHTEPRVDVSHQPEVERAYRDSPGRAGAKLVVDEDARRTRVERESRTEAAAEIGGEHRSDLPDAPNRPPLVPLLRSRREKDETSTRSCSKGSVRRCPHGWGLLPRRRCLLRGLLGRRSCQSAGYQRNRTDENPPVHAAPLRTNNWLGAKQPFPAPSSILGESSPARE